MSSRPRRIRPLLRLASGGPVAADDVAVLVASMSDASARVWDAFALQARKMGTSQAPRVQPAGAQITRDVFARLRLHSAVFPEDLDAQ